jgi:Tannase and feruloyl esterase
MPFQVQNTLHHGWPARSNIYAKGRAILLSDKLPARHAAVIAACDAPDGLADGLISQPALCVFDPATIQCADGVDDATYLTAPEVAVVRAIYDGPRDHSGVTRGAIAAGVGTGMAGSVRTRRCLNASVQQDHRQVGAEEPCRRPTAP